jgi:hypothetical protein
MAFSQQAKPSPVPTPQQQPSGDAQRASAGHEDDPVYISMQFAGGTLAEFVDVIQSLPKCNVNIVLGTEAGMVHIPGMKMNYVAPLTAIQAAVAVSEGPAGRQLALEVLGAGGEKGTTVAISQRSREGPADVTQNLMVFSIKDIIDAKGVDAAESLFSAVKLGLSMIENEPGAAAAPAADIKLHKESSLMLIRGTPRQLQTISQILDPIRSDCARLRERKERTEAAAALLKQAEERYKDAQARAEELSRMMAKYITDYGQSKDALVIDQMNTVQAARAAAQAVVDREQQAIIEMQNRLTLARVMGASPAEHAVTTSEMQQVIRLYQKLSDQPTPKAPEASDK